MRRLIHDAEIAGNQIHVYSKGSMSSQLSTLYLKKFLTGYHYVAQNGLECAM